MTGGRKLGMLALLLLAGAVQAEVYRWTDKNGKVHYGDQPPPQTEVQQKSLTDSRIDATDLPYAVRRAASTFPVTLYTAPDCKENCDEARKLLKQRKVPFSEKVVSSEAELAAARKALGSEDVRVPALVVGRQTQQGLEAGAWNQALDAAGYP